MPSFPDVDAYIGSLLQPGRGVAERLRSLIHQAVPGVGEAIKYNMPAFQLDGRSFLFFGIWKRHAGIYPVSRGNAAFEALVGAYRSTRDTVQFSLAEPLPNGLVTQIVRAQAARARASQADPSTSSVVGRKSGGKG